MSAHISLTMIVKNEAATLGRCLASVRDIVDEIVVVDTGSCDNTKEIARQYGARVFDLPWPDSFAAARNESIRQATGQWLLWLDADEYFDEANRAKLRDLLVNLGDDNTAYVMKCVCVSGQVGNTATHVDHVRLFRNYPDIRWDYRVHEQILPALKRAGHAVRFTNIAVTHTGYTDPTLRHKKLERNLRLLHLDLAERPNDAFTLFNLGWSYADLGRIAEAIPLLERSLQHSHNADSITPKLYALLTQCHHRLGQFEQAWAVCQAGHVRHPEDAELLFLKGQLCRQRGDRAGARACWVQLLSPSPLVGELAYPPPQPSPTRGEGEQRHSPTRGEGEQRHSPTRGEGEQRHSPTRGEGEQRHSPTRAVQCFKIGKMGQSLATIAIEPTASSLTQFETLNCPGKSLISRAVQCFKIGKMGQSLATIAIEPTASSLTQFETLNCPESHQGELLNLDEAV